MPSGAHIQPALEIQAKLADHHHSRALHSKLESMSDVTHFLIQIESGDRRAADSLLALVYEELRLLANQRLANEKPGQTLQAPALVHEAYLRLVGQGAGTQWNGRGHFFAAAAESMRRILIESARRKKRRFRSS